MKVRKFRYFVGDFETTVYKGQTATEVWASACVELYDDDVKIFHSISEQFEYLKHLGSNVCIYYHNLKFDGSFWLSLLLVDLGLEQAYEKLNEEGTEVEWISEKNMRNNTFRYSISDKGQWYNLVIKVNDIFIEIRDSLKLLPFSVKDIGKSFGTTHKKLEMNYKGFRYPGCEITEKEQEYIKNDVLVVKEALEIMFDQGHDKLTIGACCLAEYKKLIGKEDYEILFPSLTDFFLDTKVHRYDNADRWIRKSYKGGWCYVVKDKQNKLYYNGTTADVNSLYPSVMSSESGNPYPTGRPFFWSGNYIDEKAKKQGMYYFVRVRTRFYLKPGYLPFIQIKGNHLYNGKENLKTSDVYDHKTDQYYEKYYDRTGNLCDTRVELTLTMTDFKLMKEHYDLIDFEIIDGCYFHTVVGIFDDYIEKYKKIKLESTGALRTLAKLFLNNLYGKMASSTDSSFKVAFVKPNKSIGFISVPANDKQAGFIAVGSAITSYARDFTIRVAQQNYHGVDEPGFIYADTDSIHCDLQPEQIVGVKVHDKNFCCWKLESCWDVAIFTRQKTYIEHITHEDLKPIDVPYYSVKCAGMPDKCKNLFIKSLGEVDNLEDYTEEEQEFLKTRRTLEDFKVGLIVPGSLKPKRIPGGVLLVDETYQMH